MSPFTSSYISTSAFPATNPLCATNHQAEGETPSTSTSGNNNHLPSANSRRGNIGRGRGTPEPGNSPAEPRHGQLALNNDMRNSQMTIIYGNCITIACREGHLPTHYEMREPPSNRLARYWAKARSIFCGLFFG